MDLALWELGLLTLVGVLAGWLNVMAGGGSLLTIPIMVFMGLPGAVANGTNRVAILAQNISASIAFFRKGFKELKLGISLAIAAIPGAIIGAHTGVSLSGPLFEKVLAVVMVIMMLLMMTNKKSSSDSQESTIEKHQPNQSQLIWGHICIFGVGFWGGFIQIGVGLIIMPILNRVMGLDLVRVNALKVFIILCYTFVALAIFASNLKVFWLAGIALALGNSIGGWLGAHWAIKSGEKLIRLVLNIVLALFILKLLFL